MGLMEGRRAGFAPAGRHTKSNGDIASSLSLRAALCRFHSAYALEDLGMVIGLTIGILMAALHLWDVAPTRKMKTRDPKQIDSMPTGV